MTSAGLTDEDYIGFPRRLDCQFDVHAMISIELPDTWVTQSAIWGSLAIICPHRKQKGDPKAAPVLQHSCFLLCRHLAPCKAESGKAEA